MPRLDYFAPGIYIEEVERGSRPLEGVATSIGGFIGFTEDVKNGAELFKPMLVTTWSQYLEYFAKPGSDGFTDFDAFLPFAVNGWFLNGGGRCWITSIGTRLPGSPPPALEEVATRITTKANRPSLMFNIKPEEEGNGRITVNIIESAPLPPEDPDAEPPLNTGEFFSIIITRGDDELERYDHLSMDPEVAAELGSYAVTALQESTYVAVADITTAGQPLAKRPGNGQYTVSPPPHISAPERFTRDFQGLRDDRTGIQGLSEVDEITIMCCPDLMRAYQLGLLDIDQVHGVMELMCSMVENGVPNPPNRMVILDPPHDAVKPQQVASWLASFNRRSQYAAIYYPWIKVANPRNGGKPIMIPPSGHMAGVWARTDETRGVFKAPANDTPRGVTGLAYEVNFREQELLNPMGINCIRSFPNRGIKVWGARTLVEPDNTPWRYISVRRLMSYIEKSIEMGTSWVVFEPNDSALWYKVTRTISNFLEGLWRNGALVGDTADQAFFVKCDGSNNTPTTMLLGRLYVDIGVAPVRPAEFVIFRIGQMTGD